MGVGTWQQPDRLTQEGTEYKINLENCIAVAERLARAFAPHEQASPDMTVRLDAGFIMKSGDWTLTEVAAQSTSTITAPTTNPRIDRVVIDKLTGACSVVTGTEAADPSPPDIPEGKVPVCQVYLTPGMTEITNNDITDERALNWVGYQPPDVSAGLQSVQIFTESGTWNKSSEKIKKVLVEIYGGGGGGASGSGDGQDGGTSSFGSHCSATGGGGGDHYGAGGNGGEGTNGDINLTGGDGASESTDAHGGICPYGSVGGIGGIRGENGRGYGSGGGGNTSGEGGGGGASGYARKLIDVSEISSETVTVGSGGKGSGDNAGDGAPGLVIVWEYA